MRVDKPTAVQILIAWRDNKWIVSRNAVETGVYVYRTHAMQAARVMAAEAVAAGLGCFMLVREPDGSWEEKSCPKPARAQTGG